ncbi:MAG: DUF6503 family protein [Cytophagales bacterium]|nr:DUF6503 family protein [Cytophagales bacterium]
MKYTLATILSICSLLILTFCTNQQQAESKASTAHHSEQIARIFKAHSGFNQWAEMKTLKFSKDGEHQLIDLNSRKVLVEGEKRTIGFDGKDVWVVPDSLTNGARFYHNLYFYFYAMPFVLGDPGIHYEDVGSKELFGMNLHGIKISYGDGVGDSPKDNYVLYYDEESNTMKALMYTVTYRSQESSDKFSLIKYDAWQDVNGVLLPQKIQWYNFKNDSIGEIRNEVLFTEVSLSKDLVDQNLFTIREGAGIAGME